MELNESIAETMALSEVGGPDYSWCPNCKEDDCICTKDTNQNSEIVAIAGTCTLSASFNLNMGNFETLKINVGFSEAYTGIGDDTREAKYQMLKELVNEKFQDLTIDYAKNAKGLSSEIHKYFNKTRSKNE